MSTVRPIRLTELRQACESCSLRELCLPLGLTGSELEELDSLAKRRKTLARGEYLYHVHDPLSALYAVRHGSFKASYLTEDGRAQITGFYLPGELVGFDAISADRHPCNAQALEAAEVCEIPYGALEDMTQRVKGLHRQFVRLMSREMVHDEGLLLMLGQLNADERLAAFLLNISARHERLGLSPTQLRLSMSRQDLGQYLSLALETVSRVLSRFQRDRLVDVQGKKVFLRDRQRLGMIAGDQCTGWR